MKIQVLVMSAVQKEKATFGPASCCSPGLNKLFIYAMACLLTKSLFAGEIRYGKDAAINKPVNDNIYVAGATVTIDAPVNGG